MAKIGPRPDATNLALRLAAIVGVVYGLGFLLIPDFLLELSQDPGAPANPGWVRWAGGFVVGIAMGPYLAAEGWVKEHPYIAGLAAGYTLSGLALLYSVVSREYGGPGNVVARNQGLTRFASLFCHRACCLRATCGRQPL